MTLDEYEKLLEEKRKALLSLKVEEMKVDAKEFKTMLPLSNKKSNDDVFIKLVSYLFPTECMGACISFHTFLLANAVLAYFGSWLMLLLMRFL